MGSDPKRVPIADVVSEPSTWDPRRAGSEVRFRYIDISSIDPVEKQVVSVATIAPSEAPSRARQLVQSGDVLVSTVRPNLNAVAIVPDDLDGSTASTGFAVLRPKADNLDARYLYYWVQTPSFVRAMTARATGASYPAVTDRVVRESRIPLPPLAEQRGIAALLDKADTIRRKRREGLQLLDEFLRSAFLEMFGDPVRNERMWVRAKASSVIRQIEPGSSVKGDERRQGSDEWAVLKISSVTSGWYLPSERKVVAAPPDQPVIPRRGDLLFSRANTRELVAATCLVDRDEPRLFLPDKLWRITPNADLATVEYLRFLLADSRFRQSLTRHATGTSGSMLNVSQEKLLRLDVPVPPLALQQRFGALVSKTCETRGRIQGAVDQTGQLFDSLTQRVLGDGVGVAELDLAQSFPGR